MGDPLYDIGVNLVASLIFAIIMFAVERKFRILHFIQKIIHHGSPCQFYFACNLSGKEKKIHESLMSTLQERGYKIEITEKGYRTLLKATKENLETLQICLIAEDPFQISIEPVQTTVQSASERLTEITSMLQTVKDTSSSKIESASFEVVLPYNPGVEIKVPQNMKVNSYNVEVIDKNVKVILSLNNKVGIHSTDFIHLAATYRALI